MKVSSQNLKHIAQSGAVTAMQNALMNSAKYIDSVEQALITEQELTERFNWLLEHPDEFASAVNDAYSRWDGGGDPSFSVLFREEVAHQMRNYVSCEHCKDSGLTTISNYDGNGSDADDQPCPHCRAALEAQ